MNAADIERINTEARKGVFEAAKLHMGTRRAASAIGGIKRECSAENCPCHQEKKHVAR